ncbi:MAG: hypothetical protein COC19_06175 [SAR86 cluster bacterium]|uniref:DUF4266 domain-containing protein n=1 Tax=SAR86 cluster bacterium TaxID=2030880 RepID=A0A2A4MJI6_9GAMM|nr:MAG: hypothetical protein COC19_06175 [SAR86 cluster bacterium]
MFNFRPSIKAMFISSLVATLLSACVEVKPWQRGYLAKDEMAWQVDGLESALNKHITFSKEASSGSSSAAGGGCGCN